MQKVINHLNVMSQYARIGHHLFKGITFISDHEWLGKLYEEYTEAYDAVVEHCVGTGAVIDLFTGAKDAGEEIFKLSNNWFQYLLIMEMELQKYLDEEVVNYTDDEGTMNMIAQLWEDSQKRVYKLKGRVS